MKKIRIFSIFMVLLQIIYVFPAPIFAKSLSSKRESTIAMPSESAIEMGLSYLAGTQDEHGT